MCVICGAAVCILYVGQLCVYIMQGATWERHTDRDKNSVEAETCFGSLLLLSVVDEGAALKFCELAVLGRKTPPVLLKSSAFSQRLSIR